MLMSAVMHGSVENVGILLNAGADAKKGIVITKPLRP